MITINTDNRIVDEAWLRSIGFLPGDEDPVELGRKIWSRGEHTDYGEEPSMHVVWSSIDSSWWLETYDRVGKSLAVVELPPKSTRSEVIQLLTALGMDLETSECKALESQVDKLLKN